MRFSSVNFVWNVFNEQWENSYTALKIFRQREGHLSVPKRHKEDGRSISSWMMIQRNIKSRLSPVQIEKLNAIGFSWDPISEEWEAGFSALESFRRRNNHILVPTLYNENGVSLGSWVATQRRRRSKLSLDKIKRLDSMGFVWDTSSARWDEMYLHLKEYHRRNGHSLVPNKHHEEGSDLGSWVVRQRKKRPMLDTCKIEKLNALGFVWNPLEEQWNFAFEELKLFQKRNGHTGVPIKLVQAGINLGSWVNDQRRKRRNKTITQDHINKLNSIGFSWDPVDSIWEDSYSALVNFKNREGHVNVLKKHVENKLNLGVWCVCQRLKKKTLSRDRVNRLERLGFCWNPREQIWEEHFGLLEKFLKREGHLRVPTFHEEQGLKLGLWVSRQRRKKGLTANRIKRLNYLGFIWKI